jgi:hypothetical protein
MDTKPQSSFIPKKPSEAGALSRSGGLFPFIANMLFVVALIASVAVFAYDKYLSAQIGKMDEALSAARTAIQPDLINQLVRSDKRVISATQLVESHVTISSFFELLQSITLQNLQFTSFSFGSGEGGTIAVSMKGEARTYATVALQAKIFNDNENFVNPQFSNLDLNDKGDVVFSFKSQINPKIISYVEKLRDGAPTPTPLAPQTTITSTSSPAASSSAPN